MGEDMILQATELMREQIAAYSQLQAATTQLTSALTSSEPEKVTALVRVGESELLEMRARLLRLMFRLTAFADLRASSPADTTISSTTREAFRQASTELQKIAGGYQRTSGRSAALAINGAIFASVSMEFFGILPTTYRAPYARRGEAKAWV